MKQPVVFSFPFTMLLSFIRRHEIIFKCESSSREYKLHGQSLTLFRETVEAKDIDRSRPPGRWPPHPSVECTVAARGVGRGDLERQELRKEKSQRLPVDDLNETFVLFSLFLFFFSLSLLFYDKRRGDAYTRVRETRTTQRLMAIHLGGSCNNRNLTLRDLAAEARSPEVHRHCTRRQDKTI